MYLSLFSSCLKTKIKNGSYGEKRDGPESEVFTLMALMLSGCEKFIAQWVLRQKIPRRRTTTRVAGLEDPDRLGPDDFWRHFAGGKL